MADPKAEWKPVPLGPEWQKVTYSEAVVAVDREYRGLTWGPEWTAYVMFKPVGLIMSTYEETNNHLAGRNPDAAWHMMDLSQPVGECFSEDVFSELALEMSDV